MIGQTYSTSQNACILTLVGGPYDGEKGLFDHDKFDSIQFSHQSEKVNYIYKPSKVARTYAYAGTYEWDD